MRRLFGGLILLGACTRPIASTTTNPRKPDQPGIVQIVKDARVLADDSLRGRGPWAPETNRVARMLAARLTALGARPAVGSSLLVPFTAAPHPNDTVFNVVGVLPSSSGSINGR